MKVAGVILIFITALLWGTLKSLSLKRCCDTALLCDRLISDISQSMSYSAGGTAEIIGEFADCQRYKKLAFLKRWKQGIECGMPPESAFDKAIEDAEFPSAVCSVMRDFAGAVGRYDRENQKQLCERYHSQLQTILAHARLEYSDKGKLYRSLGLYIGAVLAVIII